MARGAESPWRLVWHYVLAISLAVFVAFLIRRFGVEAYRIPSHAMKPALEPGDTIFVSKWPYVVQPGLIPAYGDVVVFTSLDERQPFDYVKRVVALPGDTVALKKGQLILNGVNTTLVASQSAKDAVCGAERFPAKAGQTEKTYQVCWDPPILEDFGPEKVPEGAVFVIGDLRSAPMSRGWGMIPVRAIKGKVMGIWLSIEPPGPSDRAGFFSRIRFDRMFRSIQ